MSINENILPEQEADWDYDMKPTVKIPTLLLLILSVSSSYVFAGLVVSEVPLMKESTLTLLLGLGLVGLGKLGRLKEKAVDPKALKTIKSLN